MIHDNLNRLLSLSISVLIGLVGLGSSLQLEQFSAEMIEHVGKMDHMPQMIQTGTKNNDQLFQGYEVVAILSHHLREGDIQMINAGLVYVDSHQEDLEYTVDGTIIETWEQLEEISFESSYRIAYCGHKNSRATAIAFQSVAGD